MFFLLLSCNLAPTALQEADLCIGGAPMTAYASGESPDIRIEVRVGATLAEVRQAQACCDSHGLSCTFPMVDQPVASVSSSSSTGQSPFGSIHLHFTTVMPERLVATVLLAIGRERSRVASCTEVARALAFPAEECEQMRMTQTEASPMNGVACASFDGRREAFLPWFERQARLLPAGLEVSVSATPGTKAEEVAALLPMALEGSVGWPMELRDGLCSRELHSEAWRELVASEAVWGAIERTARPECSVPLVTRRVEMTGTLSRGADRLSISVEDDCSFCGVPPGAGMNRVAFTVRTFDHDLPTIRLGPGGVLDRDLTQCVADRALAVAGGKAVAGTSLGDFAVTVR